MKRFKFLWAISVSAVCALGEESAPPKLGDVSFTTVEGKQVKLSDYLGERAVVLLFTRGFPGQFACYYCGAQAKQFKGDYKKFKEEGAEVLMILPGPADGKAFLKAVGLSDELNPEPEFDVPFPILIDPDFSACKAFGVPFKEGGLPFPVNRPATIVLGKDGKPIFTHHGKNAMDRPSSEAVRKLLRDLK